MQLKKVFFEKLRISRNPFFSSSIFPVDLHLWQSKQKSRNFLILPCKISSTKKFDFSFHRSLARIRLNRIFSPIRNRPFLLLGFFSRPKGRHIISLRIEIGLNMVSSSFVSFVSVDLSSTELWLNLLKHQNLPLLKDSKKDERKTRKAFVPLVKLCQQRSALGKWPVYQIDYLSWNFDFHFIK